MVEGGAELAQVGSPAWAEAWLGARFTANLRHRELHDGVPAYGSGLAVDVGAGFGAGRGGTPEGCDTSTAEPCDEGARRRWDEIDTGRGYVELGLAVWAAYYFAWFLRWRLQVAQGEALPITLWYSALTGPEFGIGPVALQLGTGFYGLRTFGGGAGFDGKPGWLPVEAGLSVRFDVTGDASPDRGRARAAAPSTRVRCRRRFIARGPSAACTSVG